MINKTDHSNKSVQMFHKIRILKNFEKLIRNLCWRLSFHKFTGLQFATSFFKKNTQAQVFSYKF